MSGPTLPRRAVVLSIVVALLVARFAAGDTLGFGKSYAIVIGINKYSHPKWPTLNYALPDAQGVAEYLSSQGFEIIRLTEKDATRQAIVSVVEDQLVPKLTARDRVLFFFAGHGDTRIAGGAQRGYLVPYDGTDSYATLLSMSQIHELSAAMAVAKHQLFILDACFGGLLAQRGSTVDPRTPNYVDELMKRQARQVLTAGGANQRVVDGGPGGHSLFTGQLLKALREGLADTNGDGYITFSELSGYIVPAASQYNQTPGVGDLSGHEQGEFLFLNPVRKPVTPPGPSVVAGPMRSADVYDLLKAGKVHYSKANYAAAVAPLTQAADMGNAEAMTILGKLYWEGWGVQKDQANARKLLEDAANRGDVDALAGLAAISQDAEARRWQAALEQAEQLKRSIVFVDPTGKADRGEPRIAPSDIRVTPAAPMNFKVQ